MYVAVLGYGCVTTALGENLRLEFRKLVFSAAEKYHSKNQNLIGCHARVRNVC